MQPKITAQLSARQPQPVDRNDGERSSRVDLERWLDLLRRAIHETGWTVESLAAHLEIDKAYCSRLLSGEKPWTVARLVSLPDDLEARFEHLRAESFGLIVVAPLHGPDAMKALVSGLVGVLSDRLPAKAGLPVKAELPHLEGKSEVA